MRLTAVAACIALILVNSTHAQDGLPDTNGFNSPNGYRIFGPYGGVAHGVERDRFDALVPLANDNIVFGLNIGIENTAPQPLGIGKLDVTGANAGGFTTQTFGWNASTNYGYEVHSVALQSTGKILALINVPNYSNYTNSSLLYRLLANGAVDTGFGNGGSVAVSFGNSYPNDTAAEVVVQTDDRILVAATISPAPLAGAQYSDRYAMAVTRIAADGKQVDSNYGSQGVAIVSRFADISGGLPHEQLVHARLATDGGVWLAGATNYNPGIASTTQAAVGKLTSTGVLDSAFANQGALILGAQTSVLDLTRTRGHGFYLLTASGLQRFDATGQRDSNFGSFGAASLLVADPNFSPGHFVNGVGFSLAVQTDGKIIVGGSVWLTSSADRNPVAWRFLLDGTLDPNFGTGSNGPGVFMSNDVKAFWYYFPGPGQQPYDNGDGEHVALAHNQILLSGKTPEVSGFDGYIFRLNVDEIFGGDFEPY